MKLIYDSINKQKLLKDININTLISKLNYDNINNNELIINNIIDFFLNNFIKNWNEKILLYFILLIK